MPGRPNSFEALAADAAERIDAARAQGEQLTFLPDEAGAGPVATVDRDPDAPKRGKGKALNQMREFLAAKGLRMPEDLLVEMAGLASREDAILTAMQAAERVLTWAYAGATVTNKKTGVTKAVVPTPGARMSMFAQLYTIQLRALDALMPYGTPKASPDVEVNQNVTFVVPQAPSGAAPMRDVSAVSDGRMVPADVALEMQRNQGLTDTASDNSDGEDRTK